MEIALWIIAWLACGAGSVAIRYLGYHRVDLGEAIIATLGGALALLVAAYIAMETADISVQRERKK